MEHPILLERYFKDNSFVESNIRSFNNFVEKDMQKIIQEVGDIVPTVIPQDMEDFRIKLDKIWLTKPSIIEADGSKRDIYPMEGRLRSITYSSPIHLEISSHIDGVQRESFSTQIGRLPIMLKSKYCHLFGLNEEELIAKNEDPTDLGGYFILNGNERVLITVEDLAANKLFVEEGKTGPAKFVGKLFSEKGSYRVPHVIEQGKDGIINLSFTRFKRIPIITVIKALGLIKDSEIVAALSDDKQYDDVFINLYNAIDLKSEEDALEALSKKIGMTQPKEVRLEKARENLDKYLLPHLGTNAKDRSYKAINLCKLMKRFLLISKEDLHNQDKDHYMHKRLKLSGDLLSDLFRVNLRALVNDMLYNFQRLVKRGKFHSLKIIIRDKLLTSRINSAMATGVWVGGRKGLSQNIDRTNFLATTSHLQRVVSLLSSTQENFDARALHPTHWGRLCLKKDTNVLLSDTYSTRTLDQLKNCWKHHTVSTYDTQRKEFIGSSISQYHMSNPIDFHKNVFTLTLESGRSVTATQDHPFLTPKGWVDSQDLRRGDKVCVYPLTDQASEECSPKEEIIVDEAMIRKLFPHRHKLYIKELTERELLPLTTTNYYIDIIARLMGHIFTDGSCYGHNLFFNCGSLSDAEAVAHDISYLRFKPSKISQQQTHITTEKGIVHYHTWRVTKGGALYALLVAAGVPTRKKVDHAYSLPSWLLHAPRFVQKEFLGAWLGGDGSKGRSSLRPDRNSGEKLHIDNLFFYKNKKVKQSGLILAKNLMKLFNNFNVSFKKISVEEGYRRKDGEQTVKINLILGKSYENFGNILQKIGFRYCRQKELISNLLGEWLRIRYRHLAQRIDLKKQVREFYDQGMTPLTISKVFDLSYRKINGWLYESHRYKNTRLTQHMLEPFTQWIKKNTQGIEHTGLVWESIARKSKDRLDDVRDFTTAENTHSFIANGFICHNCSIETPEGTSIGLRKNLALLCEITQEEYSEAKIKKVLELAGLKP